MAPSRALELAIELGLPNRVPGGTIPPVIKQALISLRSDPVRRRAMPGIAQGLRRTLLALAVAALLVPGTAFAHALGEDYVVLRFLEDSIEGHFEIHFDELRDKLGLNVDEAEDRALASVESTAPRAEAYLLEGFSIAPEGGEAYSLTFTRRDVITLPQGTFAQYHFHLPTGPLPDRLAIRHSMFYDEDRLHRGLVLVEYNAKTDTTYPAEYTAMVFGPTNREQVLDLTDIPALMGPREMIAQGVWHIWIGIDHILFLLALMLTTVLVREKGAWKPVDSFRRAFFNLLKIVTVFTIAHSITLVLAALDIIVLPSRLVESIIALSIVLVAVNNLSGFVRDGSLLVILGLGLFHGLGFASVMGHLPFRMVDLLGIVIGFNVGVEIGQVAIVAVLFPILFWLRKSRFYQPVILTAGSILLALVAGWWFIERAFDLG